MGESVTVRASKAMSWLLRHGAVKEGLPIRSDGFVPVDSILQHKRLVSLRIGRRQLEDIVNSNDKKRFTLQDIDGVQHIKAVQGHSIAEIEVELIPIKLEDVDKYPVIIHGTYFTAWNPISKQGLSRMTRNHIHFAIGEPGDRAVISGMRRSAQVLIFLDIVSALNDNIPFFISSNNVILSPGDAHGFIPPKHFKQVLDAQSRKPMRDPSGTSPATATSSTSSTSSSSSSSSSFDYLCVLDFEATCENGKRITQEVIELPGVIVDVKSKQMISTIQFYCKPVVNPKLTEFCTELTGITQHTVDSGVPFREAWQKYLAWLHETIPGLTPGLDSADPGAPPRFAFVTCGDWDLKTMLPAQMSLLGKSTSEEDRLIPRNTPKAFKQWINIKQGFQQFKKMRYPPRGMTDMLDQYSLKLEGRHHSGIDDCKNIARVLIKMLEDGYTPKLTWT